MHKKYFHYFAKLRYYIKDEDECTLWGIIHNRLSHVEGARYHVRFLGHTVTMLLDWQKPDDTKLSVRTK